MHRKSKEERIRRRNILRDLVGMLRRYDSPERANTNLFIMRLLPCFFLGVLIRFHVLDITVHRETPSDTIAVISECNETII